MLENIAVSAYNATLTYIMEKVGHSYLYILMLRLIITPHFMHTYLKVAPSIFGV